MCTISPGFFQTCTWICTILLTDLFNLTNWSVRVCFWPYACFWCPGLHRSLFQWIVELVQSLTLEGHLLICWLTLYFYDRLLTGPLIVCTETVSKELIVKKEHFILKYKSSCTNQLFEFLFYAHLLWFGSTLVAVSGRRCPHSGVGEDFLERLKKHCRRYNGSNCLLGS